MAAIEPSLKDLGKFAVLPPCPPAEDVWLHVFHDLTARREGLFGFDLMDHQFRSAFLAELIRLEWDGRYKVKGLGRQGNKQAKAVGLIAHKLLQLITKVQTRAPHALDYEHQSLWFGRIVAEREALGYIVLNRADGRNASITRLRKDNQNLYEVNPDENPFSRPYTKRFFDIALKLATVDGEIEKGKTYNRFASAIRDYARARRAYITLISSDGKGVTTSKMPNGIAKQCRQGRKPKK